MSKNVIKMDEKFYKEGAKYLETNLKIGLDPEDLALIFKGSLQHIAEVLGENKSENAEVEVVLPDYISFKVSHREGEGGSGNFGMGIVAGPEMKKRIKSDEDLEEFNEED